MATPTPMTPTVISITALLSTLKDAATASANAPAIMMTSLKMSSARRSYLSARVPVNGTRNMTGTKLTRLTVPTQLLEWRTFLMSHSSAAVCTQVPTLLNSSLVQRMA